MFQTIVQAVLYHAEHTPDKLAIGFKKDRITYAELGHQVQLTASILKDEFGISSGDMVMISAVSKPEFIVTLLAVQYLGAITIPCDKTALTENLVEMYHFIRPKLLISDTHISDTSVNKISLVQFAKNNHFLGGICLKYTIPDKQLVAEILFTTGTTGIPKGVMLTYGNIYAITHNMKKGIGMMSDDIIMIPLPLHHSIGIRNLRTTLYIGGTVVLQNGFSFPKELTENMQTYHCTGFVSVPASIERLYRQTGDTFAEILGNLRYIEVGAGSLSYDMKKKLVKLLPYTEIINTWGSSETGGVIFLNISKNPDKLTSLGKPVDGISLKVINSNGEEIQAKDSCSAGKMALQGDMNMAGYFQLPETTTQTLVNGWLYTNDMVYTDKDGFVYMLGRSDDIINVGGEKVSPVEVENIASEYEQFHECACVGVPNPVLGQIPVLFYVLNTSEQLDQKKLIRFLSGKMETYKMPQKFIQLIELPRNRMNKLDRKEMQTLWNDIGDTNLMNPVIQTILSRRSTRNFTEKRIPRTILEMIIKAGIQAPSGNNMQTWHFTVIRNRKKIQELKALIKKVADAKKIFFYGMNNPDTLILISNDRRNANRIQDSSVAAENMMIAAQSYGIGSVWLNVLTTIGDEPEIRYILNELGIPLKHDVWASLAMGYPADEPKAITRKTNVVSWIE